MGRSRMSPEIGGLATRLDWKRAEEPPIKLEMREDGRGAGGSFPN
eukprot:CAMPEP_0194750932 /NCGR_PEP_ID=MMETSP0323_2-20130528/5033_1 /TAXON_ID=2866 ORGANISM="Crypthecodinium cohnii, Strain Seligo" /NCGR_SAMPLE_ID=MMETSP0323_2 /ASSEMBLY_ACC=CAM_ASM_000346 /LENGTH=44 /DNA_ID= /DNA_START= /DNA_END= /DNA_ORIENTATION=